MSSAANACTVLVCGEGPSDIGDLGDRMPPTSRGKQRKRADTGFVPPIVRKIAAEEKIEVSLLGYRHASLPKVPGQVPSMDDVMSKKARAAMAIARTDGARVLVLTHDVDKEQGVAASPLEGKRSHRRVVAAMRRGCEDFARANPGAPRYVLAAPLRTIEAWALATIKAVEADGGDASNVPKRSPERLWGAPNDPEGNHPKHVLSRCFAGRVDRERMARLAEAADLDTLAERCPISFAPFLAEGRRLANECADTARRT